MLKLLFQSLSNVFPTTLLASLYYKRTLSLENVIDILRGTSDNAKEKQN